MSQAATAVRAPARTARPAARAAGRPAPAGRRLRAVSAPPQTRSRAGVAVVCLVALVAGLVGLLMVNISLSHGAYELYDLRQEQVRLSEQKQTVSEEIAGNQAPQTLEKAARSLGMVPAGQVAFVHLKDGAVSGAPEAAEGARTPTVGDRP